MGGLEPLLGTKAIQHVDVDIESEDEKGGLGIRLFDVLAGFLERFDRTWKGPDSSKEDIGRYLRAPCEPSGYDLLLQRRRGKNFGKGKGTQQGKDDSKGEGEFSYSESPTHNYHRGRMDGRGGNDFGDDKDLIRVCNKKGGKQGKDESKCEGEFFFGESRAHSYHRGHVDGGDFGEDVVEVCGKKGGKRGNDFGEDVVEVCGKKGGKYSKDNDSESDQSQYFYWWIGTGGKGKGFSNDSGTGGQGSKGNKRNYAPY